MLVAATFVSTKVKSLTLSHRTRQGWGTRFSSESSLFTVRSCLTGTRRWLWFCLACRSAIPLLLPARAGSALCVGPRCARDLLSESATLLYACLSVECRWRGRRAYRRVCARG